MAINITELTEETVLDGSEFVYGVRDGATPTDFKMTIDNMLNSGVGNSIAGTPTRLGEIAIAAGEAYIAVGTTSSADWKQIT